MLRDAGSGLLIYTFATFEAGRSPSLLWLVVALIASAAPDTDWVIYFVKKWRGHRVLSHHFWHFPLPWMAACLALGYFLGDWYTTVVILGPMLGHFVSDTFSPTGIRWLWPIAHTSISLFDGLGLDQPEGARTHAPPDVRSRDPDGLTAYVHRTAEEGDLARRSRLPARRGRPDGRVLSGPVSEMAPPTSVSGALLLSYGYLVSTITALQSYQFRPIGQI